MELGREQMSSVDGYMARREDFSTSIQYLLFTADRLLNHAFNYGFPNYLA